MTRYIAEIGTSRTEIDLAASVSSLKIDGRPAEVSHSWLDSSHRRLLLLIDGRSYDMQIDEHDGELVLTHSGRHYNCRVIDARLAEAERLPRGGRRESARSVIKSPMPGMVIKVLVQQGATVDAGDRLIVLEAMKMENDVKAPHAGRVSSIVVAPGQKVEGGQELAIIE